MVLPDGVHGSHVGPPGFVGGPTGGVVGGVVGAGPAGVGVAGGTDGVGPGWGADGAVTPDDGGRFFFESAMSLRRCSRQAARFLRSRFASFDGFFALIRRWHVLLRRFVAWAVVSAARVATTSVAGRAVDAGTAARACDDAMRVAESGPWTGPVISGASGVPTTKASRIASTGSAAAACPA